SGSSICCSSGAFSGDGGPAVTAQLNAPGDVAGDTAGNVFIARSGNLRARKISTDGTISTVAGNGTSCRVPMANCQAPKEGGLATSERLSSLWGVAADGAGNLFIADAFTGLRKVTPDGTITTVVDGPGDGVSRVTIDSSGNLYLTDGWG